MKGVSDRRRPRRARLVLVRDVLTSKYAPLGKLLQVFIVLVLSSEHCFRGLAGSENLIVSSVAAMEDPATAIIEAKMKLIKHKVRL
jgi:hypothetical protein